MRSEIYQSGTTHKVAEHLQQGQSENDNGDGASALWPELVGVDDDHGEHDDRGQQSVEKSTQYFFRHFGMIIGA